ncbi:MAG: hypothetical protein CMF52_03295 [Legionellales bacterium]|nr:hypothetical protein [Legionellales bacterium]|tara:strand:- start:633 stop:1517 length:885 start_codon:yes stop_codon:yes gene_type:complete
MLPDNFDFAMLPATQGTGSVSLEEIGMLKSDIENIDYAMTSYLKIDLALEAQTNEGREKVPVLWQAPERAFQVKNEKSLRDQRGALKLPLISVERTAINKNPANKGSFQAQIYSREGDQRTGRMVVAKRIVKDKTRNFAVAQSMRSLPKSSTIQKYYPRINKKIIIQTLSIPIPVYVELDYKINIKTEYQQQMNELMAPFIARTGQINSFVMKRNGHRYEAFIQPAFAHNNNMSNLNEDIRMFSTDINIKVLGYLIGEGENDDRNLVRIDENTVEITYPRESEPLPGESPFTFD